MKIKNKITIKEAFLFDSITSGVDIMRWAHPHISIQHVDGEDPLEHIRLKIETLEGTMIANKGDWVIKGLRGEFYPCKPDIFEASYEKVD